MTDGTHKASDGTVRKSYYGAGKQPWDIMVELGWGAPYAAGCVLKYLRRPDKNPFALVKEPFAKSSVWDDTTRGTVNHIEACLLAATRGHSHDSARWFYARLVEGVHLVDRISDRHVIVWADVLMQLHKQLTPEEFAVLEGK